ncbi:hypothetical protein Tco_1515807 [Tanacetum coccineum]
MESRIASFFEHIFPCLSKETRSSSRLDDEVFQDKRQRDDNGLQDKRQDQTEEEVEPRRSKRARNEKSFRPDFVSFMVGNEPTSYREAVPGPGFFDFAVIRLNRYTVIHVMHFGKAINEGLLSARNRCLLRPRRLCASLREGFHRIGALCSLYERFTTRAIRMTNTQTPPPATIVVIPTGVPATNTMANHAERPEKFKGPARFLIKKTAPQVEPSFVRRSHPLMHRLCKLWWKHGNISDFLDKRRNDKKSKGKSKYLAPKAGIVKQKCLQLRANGSLRLTWLMLYMGNSATADIKGEGDVILKDEIREELIFESDKFVLSKNQIYVGKGYAVNAMFKLNVMVVKNDINKMNSSSYLIEFSNVWHGRLRHVVRSDRGGVYTWLQFVPRFVRYMEVYTSSLLPFTSAERFYCRKEEPYLEGNGYCHVD